LKFPDLCAKVRHLRLSIFLLLFSPVPRLPLFSSFDYYVRMSQASFFENKSILITGASSGIGEELAVQLAALGAHLTLTARRRELLDNLAQRIGKGKATPLVIQADVTNDTDIPHAVSEAVRVYNKLDIVIANAGFGVVGPFRKLSLDDYRRQLETNVFGLIRTVQAALPAIEQSKGNVVLIGSVAGWAASPGASPYAMSKFAVRALANSITPELALSGVKVTLISPGFVASNIRRVDNQGALHSEAREPIPDWIVVRTDKAVRDILRAVARGRREAIITGHGKILVVLERFAPWIIRAVGKRMAAKRGGYRTEPK
jgi:short-subunit dehydrogenase